MYLCNIFYGFQYLLNSFSYFHFNILSTYTRAPDNVITFFDYIQSQSYLRYRVSIKLKTLYWNQLNCCLLNIFFEIVNTTENCDSFSVCELKILIFLALPLLFIITLNTVFLIWIIHWIIESVKAYSIAFDSK